MEGYEDGNGIVSWTVHPNEDTIAKVEDAIWRKCSLSKEEEPLQSFCDVGDIYAIGEDIYSFRVLSPSHMSAQEAADKFERLETLSFADADWDTKLLPSVDENMEATTLVVDMKHHKTEVSNPNIEDLENYINQYSANEHGNYGFIDKNGHLVPSLDIDDYYETR